MKLTTQGLRDRASWEARGYSLPAFDREAMISRTKAQPQWIHFGGGNIFRAFHAHTAQQLLNAGGMDRGIIMVDGDPKIVRDQYRLHDNCAILVNLQADGSVRKTVLGSIAESLVLGRTGQADFLRLQEIFSAPSLQLATFTITEKGYRLKDSSGTLLPEIQQDAAAGPAAPDSYLGRVAALLYTRYLRGGHPIAMVSTDNCSHNGDQLRAAMTFFADQWTGRGLAEEGFAGYVRDPAQVSFPWTMIDKITPRPDPSVEKLLQEDGIEDLTAVISSRNSYVAPFVNAESTEYLVVEDAFPAGRPPLEKAGLLFTDRETVDKVESMKVFACLNPLHTALAIYGCLLGYQRISEEMKDPDLLRLVQVIGYQENLPVVTDPGILDPKEFMDTCLQVRFPNPFMPDTPQRIATDTSQKLSVRFGQTLHSYLRQGKSLQQLRGIPLVFAGWLRYLMAVDDEGKPFSLSPDPLLESVCPCVADIPFDARHTEEKIGPLLRNSSIFGVDLYEAGLAHTVITDFEQLIEGPGAVRRTLAALADAHS